ncbi:PaaI family thioesterase [Alcanivorax sp. DP30]|uniref:PaaI family thioesterase n=1 Tax=Alcanivorax sp. DP30 TaxID=2606217 RepID=UPI00136F8A39|nr:PaaI family thioesterase [Alcanivorax sp. DP30]MZR63935.1 PaaI family thioesterase [Alcanivorax sp. DP30]
MKPAYHFRDIRVAETPPPSRRALLHRQLGQALAGLNEQVLRLDAPEDVLEELVGRVETLRAELAGYGQRDYGSALTRLLGGQGSVDDVTDLVDFEILSGKASPLSPPLELWLDGDRVRGKAHFGLAYQGPPGRVHGGVLALALDMLMAKSQDFVEQIGMTGTLNIRYLAGTPIQHDVDFEAKLVRLERRKLVCEGAVWVNGVQTVAAEGVWISAHGDYRLKTEYQNLENAIRTREAVQDERTDV